MNQMAVFQPFASDSVTLLTENQLKDTENQLAMILMFVRERLLEAERAFTLNESSPQGEFSSLQVHSNSLLMWSSVRCHRITDQVCNYPKSRSHSLKDLVRFST
jgi:hypothetical protein